MSHATTRQVECPVSSTFQSETSEKTATAVNSPVDIDTAWLSAQEIADLHLSGLPTTKRGVHDRATAEEWPSKPRLGRGGGRVYSALHLPEAARNDLIARRKAAVFAETRSVGRPVGTDWFTSHPDVADAVLVILAEQRISSRNVMKMLETQFSGLPSPSTLRRFMAKVEADNRVLLTAMRDPDRFKSRYRPALGRMDATVSYAHEMWEIDTTKADVMCTDGRKNILGIIDRWSRRARFLVVESESAQSVRRMLITTIQAWGAMPASLKVDNGSGFMNASIGTALDLLGIKLDPCLPGHPEDKPHVERLFGTFNRERASILGGFIGHNVAQAQQLRAKAKKATGRAVVEAKISSVELQAVLDAWVDGEYHVRTHSSLRMSPLEKWQRSPTPATAAPSDSVLRIALSVYVGTGTVTKRGVRWKSGRYWAEPLAAYMDRQVILRRDEADLGALFVFDEDGQYIDTAVNVERSGMSEQQFALAARRHVANHVAAAKADLRKKQGAFSIEKARDELLRREAEDAGKLVHLPMPARTRTTPSMDSITNAPEPHMPASVSVAAAMAATERAPVQPQRTPAEKVAEADAVIAAAARGETVDDAALRRARNYAATAEYQAEKIMAAHFGAPPPAKPERHSGAA